MPRELSVETRGHWKSVLPGPQHTPWWRSVQGWWRDIFYLSEVIGGGKPGRISTLQLGREPQAPPGGATSGQPFSSEGVASMGLWRTKWEEGLTLLTCVPKDLWMGWGGPMGWSLRDFTARSLRSLRWPPAVNFVPRAFGAWENTGYAREWDEKDW